MTDMTRLMLKPEVQSGTRLTPTDVDRRLEDIAGRLLTTDATEQDRVEYQKLLSWRRSNILDLPRFSSRKLGKI